MRAVLGELVDGAGTDGETWPSLATIATHTGFSHRAVQMAVRRLEEHGYLQRKLIPGRVSHYLVLFPHRLPKLGRDDGTHEQPFVGTHEQPFVTPTNSRSSPPTNSRSGGVRTAVRDTHEQPFVPNRNSEENSEENSEVELRGGTTRSAPPTRPSQNCKRHPQGTDLACSKCAAARTAYEQWAHLNICRATNCDEPIDPAEPKYRYCPRHVQLLAPSNRTQPQDNGQ